MLLVNLGLSCLETYLVPESYKTQIILNEAVQSVVQKAHTRYKHEEEESTKPKCLLELLFDAEDTDATSRNRSLSHKELQEETKTFLVAGKISIESFLSSTNIHHSNTPSYTKAMKRHQPSVFGRFTVLFCTHMCNHGFLMIF